MAWGRGHGLGMRSRLALSLSLPPPPSSRDFPCAEEADAEGITQEQCDVAYAYRHSLDFTADPSLFQAMVNSSTVSASTDSPESTLEAMLQAAVCEVSHMHVIVM